MQIRRTTLLGAVAVAATVSTAALVVPGVAFADDGAGAKSGKITFLIVQQDVQGKQTASVVIHGAINTAGPDTSADNSDVDTAHLPGGTLRVTHPDKDAKFSFKPNTTTCYYAISGTGSYTLGRGTGKYKGLSGSGSYKLVGGGFAPRRKNGSCNFTSDGGPFDAYVNGSGPVTLP